MKILKNPEIRFVDDNGDWREKKLNSILQPYAEKNLNNYPSVAVGKYGIRSREEIYSKELSKSDTRNKVIRKDTLTVGMGSTQIDIGILHDDELFSVSPAYHTFNIIQNDSRFIESSFEKNNERYSRQHMIIGARQGKSVDFQSFLNDIIHLPTLKTQQKISSLLSNIDQKINAEEDLIQKLKDAKSAMLLKMFPRENQSVPELRFVGFVDAWEQRKFENFCTIVTKQTGFDYTATIKKSLIQESSDDSFQYLQTKNFTGTTIDYNTDYYIPQKIAREFPKINLNEKCVLFSIVGASVGNIGLFPGNKHCFLSGAICVSKFIDETDADYLYHFMCSTWGQSQIKTCTKGGAQATITIEDIRNFDVKTPSKNERDKMGNFFTNLDHLITLHQRK